MGDVPRYDRCTNDQLQFSYSASKRGPATLLVAEEAAQGAAGRPVKRLRLGSNRCFNCGSYAHAMRECWREVDRQAVEEGRRCAVFIFVCRALQSVHPSTGMRPALLPPPWHSMPQSVCFISPARQAA